jgi:hypothetical protein
VQILPHHLSLASPGNTEAGTEKLAFFAGDLRLATLENTATPTLAFHHPDHLSSAGVDTDPSGNVLQLTDYYPYGDSRIDEASTGFHNDYTYTDKKRDEDTGFNCVIFRYPRRRFAVSSRRRASSAACLVSNQSARSCPCRPIRPHIRSRHHSPKRFGVTCSA